MKHGARLGGVSEVSLRAWERRYGVVAPQRNESGYRVYGAEDLVAVSTMRRLVDEGWSPGQAAKAVRAGTVPTVANRAGVPMGDMRHRLLPAERPQPPSRFFLSAAVRLDIAGIGESLDGGFALGSFEHVIDPWLFLTLQVPGRA